MANKIIGIYKITSPANKIYIGQSINIKGRWKRHKHISNKMNTKLYCSIKKYGAENHKFEILEICTELELNKKEEYYIAFYNTFNTENGLNHTKGGDQNNDGIKQLYKNGTQAWNKGLKNYISEETRNKIKAARAKQPPMSEDGKRSVSQKSKLWHTGYKFSQASKNKMRNSQLAYHERIKQERLMMVF